MKARQRLEVDSSDSPSQTNSKSDCKTLSQERRINSLRSSTSKRVVSRQECSPTDDNFSDSTKTTFVKSPISVKRLGTLSAAQLKPYNVSNEIQQNVISSDKNIVTNVNNHLYQSTFLARKNHINSVLTNNKEHITSAKHGNGFSREGLSTNDGSKNALNKQFITTKRLKISFYNNLPYVGSVLSLILVFIFANGFWIQTDSFKKNLKFSVSNNQAPVWSESIEEMLEYQRKNKKLPPLPPIKNQPLVGLAPKGNYLPNKQLPEELVFNNKENPELVFTSQMNDPRITNEIDLKKGYLRKITQQVYSVVKKYPEKIDAVELTAMIVAESLKSEIDPLLVASVIRIESAFNPKAISPVGAQGLMQIMPATKTFIENMEAIDPTNRKSIFSPRYNIKLGVAYLRYLKELYNGNISLALMAYNWGPGHIAETLKNKKTTVPHSVLRYALKVLEDHSAWYALISTNILFE